MVGKSGFIRDPSGLLMSVIRTLEDHQDERHRDTEREKLEEAYSDVDDKLNGAVEANFTEIKSTIERFGEIGSGITNCRARMADVKEKLVQCKQLLHCRQDELRALWVEGIEHKKTMALLDHVNQIQETPTQVDKLVQDGNYLEAARSVSRALKWCQGELGEVGALHDIRSEIHNKHHILYKKILDQLQNLIYSRVTDDDDANRDMLSQMDQCANALNILGKTDEGVEEIHAQIDTKISSIVNRETTGVSDKSFHQETKPDQQLLMLLENLIVQLRQVAKMHHRLIMGVPSCSYTVEEVWFKIQNILKLLLREYLEEENSGRNFTSMVGAGGKRKMKLFRFDASTHAISMNTYLREKRAQDNKPGGGAGGGGGSANHAYFSAVPVCKTSARNITKIYRPLMNFIEEIEKEVNQDYIDLRHYVSEHIQKTFINQVKSDLRHEIDAATKVTDPLKVIADAQQQRQMDAPTPILQSAMVVCKSVEELVDVLTELDAYRETFFGLICVVLQEFQRSIQESLQNLLKAEDENASITSTSLVATKKLKEMIQSSSCWRRAFGIKVKADDKDDPQAKLAAEAALVTSILLEQNLNKENIIEDTSDMKALANLHESLEWLNLRLRKTFARLNADVNAEGDILMNLNNILSKFQSVSEQCLLYLHMEQRVRCFLYLGQIFRGARFDVKNSVALETDPEVAKLETEFRHIEEVLSSSLQSQKYRFVFEGLGHQLGSLLMEGCRHMTRISPAGVKKVCRNIFTLQQALTNITMNREPALDQARQYYELLYQRPDELVNTVEESGAKYPLDAYLTALSLSYKSMGDIDIGSQTRHRQLEERLTEVCRSQSNAKPVNVDDCDF